MKLQLQVRIEKQESYFIDVYWGVSTHSFVCCHNPAGLWVFASVCRGCVELLVWLRILHQTFATDLNVSSTWQERVQSERVLNKMWFQHNETKWTSGEKVGATRHFLEIPPPPLFPIAIIAKGKIKSKVFCIECILKQACLYGHHFNDKPPRNLNHVFLRQFKHGSYKKLERVCSKIKTTKPPWEHPNLAPKSCVFQMRAYWKFPFLVLLLQELCGLFYWDWDAFSLSCCSSLKFQKVWNCFKVARDSFGLNRMCHFFFVKTYCLWHKQLENEIILGGHHAGGFQKMGPNIAIFDLVKYGVNAGTVTCLP